MADAPRASIRLATEEDTPGIVRVYIRAYAQPPWLEQNDPIASEGYLRWVMGQPQTSCFITLGRAGEVLGFVLASPRDLQDFIQDWERMADRPAEGWPAISGRLGYVWELAVDPAALRRGIGSALLQAAIDRLREQQVEKVVLRSSERADAAVGLYQKFGFERWPVRERRDPLAGPWVLTLPPK